MTLTWKDTTSYALGDKERVPTVWTAVGVPHIKITVHRWHGVEGEWFISAPPLFERRRASRGDDLEAAKAEALQRVRAAAAEILRATDQ